MLLTLLKHLPFRHSAGAGAQGLVSTPDRRGFLGVAGGAAFFAIFGSGLGRALRANQSVEGARDQVAASLGTATDGTTTTGGVQEAMSGSFDGIDGISTVITPNDDFYLIDTALRKPQVDPATWSMRIHGMVDNEIELTFDDLLAMDQIEETITLSCVSNQVGGGLVGNAVCGPACRLPTCSTWQASRPAQTRSPPARSTAGPVASPPRSPSTVGPPWLR